VTVLDASAIVAFLLDEPAGAQVGDLLRQTPAPSISAINLAEVIDRLVRVGGRDAEQVNDAIDLLIVGGLEILPFWLPHARQAATIRADHYDRTKSPLSLADCACLVTALSERAALATTDPALAQAAADLGVQVIPLPDSTGQRP
jgi:PIN domain nuclease of toxin-antitoxin system